MSDTVAHREKLVLKSSVLQFVIYPRGGLVASGTQFVTNPWNISGMTRPEVGSEVTKADVLHTWWRSLSEHEVKSMVKDGITLDAICRRMDVVQLG